MKSAVLPAEVRTESENTQLRDVRIVFTNILKILGLAHGHFEAQKIFADFYCYKTQFPQNSEIFLYISSLQSPKRT